MSEDLEDLEQHNVDDDLALLRQYVDTQPASDEVKASVLAVIKRMDKALGYGSRMAALCRLTAQHMQKDMNTLALGVDLLVNDIGPDKSALPGLLSGLFLAHKQDRLHTDAILAAMARHLFPTDKFVHEAYPQPAGGPTVTVAQNIDDLPPELRALVKKMEAKGGDGK